jgi:ribosomal protein S18 acetylase RimI-like enzyme
LEYTIPVNNDQLNDAVNLFSEYANSLNISLDFQNFKEELNIISSMYGSPTGCLLLVYDNNAAIACAAYRNIGESICELKRMYIKPAFRGKGIGQQLVEILCEKAKINGYRAMRLDTLDTMLPAIKLYHHNGFYNIPAYYHNPNTGVVYMEKLL